MKEKKQKQSLDRIIKQSFAYQEEAETERLRRASENMMKWNKENLSPNGGKKPFVKTEPQQPKPRRHTRWLTKSNEE